MLTESWKAGFMKTTIDLPADLVKAMKLRALNEGRKLKDVAGEIFQKGLEATSRKSAPSPQKAAMKFPLFGKESDASVPKISITEALQMEQESQTLEDHEQAGVSF